MSLVGERVCKFNYRLFLSTRHRLDHFLLDIDFSRTIIVPMRVINMKYVIKMEMFSRKALQIAMAGPPDVRLDVLKSRSKIGF